MTMAKDFIFDPSLVLYLPLYEVDGASIRSRDAYGHLATVTGALWTPGGRNFDGIDDDINLGTTAILCPASALTLECWFKPDQVATYGRLVDRFPTSANGYKGYSLYHGASFGFQVYIGSALAELSGFSSIVSANNWHHVVATYDGSYMRIFLNGELASTPLAKTGSIVYYESTDFKIGHTTVVSSQRFDGLIGEVRVYSRALTASEIQRNYLVTRWRY